MGQGIAIVPQEGKVYAPFDGVADTVFETGHALGLSGENGVEVLIHVGIDTVNLQGKYFQPKISSHEKIKKGQLLLEFDKEAIQKEGYEIVTPVIITNSEKYGQIQSLVSGQVEVGREILKALK